MEPIRPDGTPDEVLSTGRPPGALERWAGSLAARRGFRAVVAAVLLVGALGAWLAFSSRHPATEARPGLTSDQRVSAPGLRPTPSGDGTNPWAVGDDLAIRSGPRGHTITFHAVNTSHKAAWPSNLRVDARFLDTRGLIYQAHCFGFRATLHGRRAVDGAVAPGGKVFVRCRDITHYAGKPPRISPWTVHITTVPCGRESGPTV